MNPEILNFLISHCPFLRKISVRGGYFFFAIALFVSSSYCAMIGDFAPTTIGSKWVYSCVSLSQNYRIIGFDFTSDTIAIEVQSTQIRGNDTLVLLKTIEKGMRFIGAGVWPAAAYDSIKIDSQYVDTALISGDSIVKMAGARCRIFPFYKSHFCPSDSISLVVSNNDTLAVLTVKYSNPGHVSSNSKYLQNVGFYETNDTGWISMIRGTNNFRLITYNNKEIPLAVHHSTHARRPGMNPSQPNAAIVLSSPDKSEISGEFFQLNGRIPKMKRTISSNILVLKKVSQ